MPSYPPAIKSSDFTDQPIPTVGKPQWNAFVARARYESGKRNRVAIHECGIDDLWLGTGAHRLTTESFDSSHFLETGPQSAQRGHFAPIVENPPALIHWRLTGFAHIHTLILQLYRRDDPQPLWEKTITWLAGTCPMLGGTPFNGSLENTPAMQAATAANAVNIATHHVAPDFPDDCLNIEFSPYKLRATIPPDPTLRRTPASRFIYFDILVADITLALGPATMIPAAPITAAQLALHQDTLARLTADGLPAKNATRRVVLKSNVFRGAATEQTDNSGHDQYQAMWGDGPQIPLEATIQILDSADHPVAAPLALGNAKFLWEWTDEAKDPRARQIAGQAAPAKYLAKTYDYDVKTTQPRGTNCHVDRGGKRGPGGAPVFPPQAGYPGVAGAVLVANQLPYPVTAGVNRTWAGISRPWTRGVCAGKTGVIFSPSRMAGDAYKLAVYYAHDKDAAGNPALDTAEPLKAAHCVQETTGTFEVWRKVEVARFLVKPGIADFCATAANVAFVRERYEAAFIELVFAHGAVAPIGGVINQATYNGLFSAGITANLGNNPNAVHMVDPAADHWSAPSLFQTRNFAQYQVARDTFLNTVHATAAAATAALAVAGNAAPTPAQILTKQNEMKAAWINQWGAANELAFIDKVSGFCQTVSQSLVNQLDVFAAPGAIQEGIVVLQCEFQSTALREYVNAGNPVPYDGNPPYILVVGTATPNVHATRNTCLFMLYANQPGIFSHENGHHLFLCHFKQPAELGRHDANHDRNPGQEGMNCLMQDVNRPRPGFCGLCQLRLRGWSIGPAHAPLLNRDGALNRRG